TGRAVAGAPGGPAEHAPGDQVRVAAVPGRRDAGPVPGGTGPVGAYGDGASVPGAGAQRQPGRPGLRRLHREDLVDADAVLLEGGRGGGQVEPPDAGPARAGQTGGAVPVRLQVLHPAAQGERVVLADRLHVAHLEPGALQQAHGGADGGEFAVGEDVGVDERVQVVGPLVPLGAAGDLVVEQPPAGRQEAVQVAGVLQVAGGADVLGHADGGDRVEGAVGDVPVVLHPDLHPVGQALLGDAFAGV